MFSTFQQYAQPINQAHWSSSLVNREHNQFYRMHFLSSVCTKLGQCVIKKTQCDIENQQMTPNLGLRTMSWYGKNWILQEGKSQLVLIV